MRQIELSLRLEGSHYEEIAAQLGSVLRYRMHPGYGLAAARIELSQDGSTAEIHFTYLREGDKWPL